MVFVLDIDVPAGRRPVAENTDAGGMQPDVGESLGLGVGQRAELQRIDDAEDCAVSADAHGQRKYDYGGQADVFTLHRSA
jgi:hypothetical protein